MAQMVSNAQQDFLMVNYYHVFRTRTLFNLRAISGAGQPYSLTMLRMVEEYGFKTG